MSASACDLEAVLEATGAAVAVLDGSGTVRFATAAFRARTRVAAGRRIELGHDKLTEAGEAHTAWVDAGLVRVCRLKRLRDGSIALTLLGGVLGPSDPVQGPRLLRDLWGLTPCEADTAWRNALGASLAEIAEARAVSIETVRTQMRMVREKAGVARGRDLQALCWSALASPGAALAA